MPAKNLQMNISHFMVNDPSPFPPGWEVKRSLAAPCLTCTVQKSPLGGFRGSYSRFTKSYLPFPYLTFNE